MEYFVHNGFMGWCYGLIGNPQLITEHDAQELMKRIGLSQEEVAAEFPPAQFAEENEPLFHLFGKCRFIQYGNIMECGDIRKSKVSKPLQVDWNEI